MLPIRPWLQRRRSPRGLAPRDTSEAEHEPRPPDHGASEADRVRADIELLRAELALLMARRSGEEHPA